MRESSNKTSRRDFLKAGAGAAGAFALIEDVPNAAPHVASPTSRAVDNVIVIISDTMRRDALGAYGGNWIRTPHLDRFAQQAMIFDNAFVSSFPTVPLRNDILTGRYTFTYKGWAPLDEDEVTLQETLHKAGILTALVVDTPHPFAPGYNYQRGFESWQLIRGQEHDAFRSAPRHVKLPCAPGKLRMGERTVTQYLRNVARRNREEDYFAAQTMTRAAEWLEENRDGRRFFLYVDTFDPHEPWDPPRYYVEQYDPGYDGEEVIYPRYDVWRDFLSERELQHCRALYAGEATMVDRWVGFLLDRIATLDLLKSTAVIFLGDHGFYLGEHGYIGKSLIRDRFSQSLPLYPEVARVPFLVYFPGCQGGSHVKALVQPVDLMPTVLDLLGVAKPPSVESASLAPILEGGAPKVKDIAISSPALVGGKRTTPPPRANRSSITDGEWLLIYGAQSEKSASASQTAAVDSIVREERILEANIRPELYHLPEDPGATRNLINEKHGAARDLHSAYLEFLRGKKYPVNLLEYLTTLG